MFAQQASNYVDPVNGFSFTGLTDPVHSVTYGLTFPPLDSTGSNSEFIGEITAPSGTSWVGLALGGAMAQNILLVAWPNAGKIVASTRWAS